MAANTRYWPCPVCGRQTRQIRNGGYEVPHVAHLLAIIALGIVVAPAAGGLWAFVYAIHAGADLLERQSLPWTCTACGRELPPRSPPQPPLR